MYDWDELGDVDKEFVKFLKVLIDDFILYFYLWIKLEGDVICFLLDVESVCMDDVRFFIFYKEKVCNLIESLKFFKRSLVVKNISRDKKEVGEYLNCFFFDYIFRLVCFWIILNYGF